MDIGAAARGGGGSAGSSASRGGRQGQGRVSQHIVGAGRGARRRHARRLPAEVSVVDDQQKPEIAREAVERFTKRDHVDLITGMVFSNVLLPVMPAILNSGTIYLSTNTGPEDYAGEKCNPNFFAVAW